MTVSSSTSRADYNGNGITDNFTVPFRFLAKGDLLVLRTVTATGTSTELILDSLGADGFSVVGAGQPSGGTITTVTAPPAGTTVSILRSVSRTQLTDYIPNDPFPAESHERALDKLTMIVQEQDETITRALVLPPGLPGTSATLPLPDPLKGLRWNAGASGIENYEITPFAAPGGSSNVGFLQAGIGASARTVQDKLRERATVLDFINVGLHAGLSAGTELSPQQAAFNAAVTAADEVFIPAGTYYLSDAVTVPLGKKLVGAGRRKTIIKVPATFNLAALGIFRFAAGEPGAAISDLTIEFEQPDSAVIGAYTQYPPAIYAVGAPRFLISRVRIAMAWNGIDMKGNSGGATIDDLELSMFNIGIDIQGSMDTVRISKLHLWPFGIGSATFTANQRTVWKDAYGIKSEKMDGLKLSDSLIYEVRKGLYFYKGAGAADLTLAGISNVGFDGDGSMHIIDDARISITTCYWTKGASDGTWITMTGGQCRVSSSRFAANNVAIAGNGLLDISGGNLWLTGCSMERSLRDHRFVYASNSAVVNISGCTAFSNAGTTYANPAIHFAGTSVGVVSGLYTPAKGGGTGRLVQIDSDNGVTVTGVVADGWTVQPPATRIKTIITDNVGPEQDQFAGCVDSAGVAVRLPSGWTCARLGAGNYTVTHNLSLNAVRDMVFNPTGEVSDAVAVWSVTESTTAVARIRTTIAGAAADAAFSFIARRCR